MQRRVVQNSAGQAGGATARRLERDFIAKDGSRDDDEEDDLDVTEHLERDGRGGCGDEELGHVQEEGHE